MIAYYSNLAMVTSTVVYLLALTAFALEWALARTSTSAPVEAVLAGAGGPPIVAPAAEPAPDRGRLRIEQAGRIGVALTTVAAATHLAGVACRGIAAGRMPWGNMYEFVTSSLLFVVIAFLVLALRFGMRWLGLPTTLLLVIGQGCAVTVFFVDVAPLMPALHSVWFVIHIVAAAVAGAAFNVGGLASILYLLKARAERRGRVQGYLARIPSIERIDEVAFRFHAFAFPLWTFAIAAGSVWAQFAWGRFWGWDPKETWSLITWVVYAGYLHARVTAGWRGARAARIAILGVAVFWFNFVGINLLLTGLHSYAGI